MKFRIIIGILVVTNMACFLFGYLQKVAADEQRELAKAASQEANLQRQIALEQRAIAEANAEEAQRQSVIAMEEARKAREAAQRCK